MRVGRGVINVNTAKVSDFLRSFGVTWRTTRIALSVVIASVAMGIVMHSNTYRPPVAAGSDPLPIEDVSVSDVAVAGAQAAAPTMYVPRPAAYTVPVSNEPPASNSVPTQVPAPSPSSPIDTAPEPLPPPAPIPPLPPVSSPVTNTVDDVVGGVVGVVGGVLGSLTGR